MRILLVSDSHGNTEALNKLSELYPNMDLYLHCGDSESHPYSLMPFRSVKGNCDYSFDLPEELIIPTIRGNIYIRHKNNQSHRYLIDNNIKYYLYGHTHIKNVETIQDIYYINPGSISYPRDVTASYVIMDIEQKTKITFYDLDTNKVIRIINL